MTINQPTSHPHTWRRPAAAIAAAATAATLALATAPAPAASAAPAAALLTGPTVHEQQALNQNIAIATGGAKTTATTSPVLAAHSYLVNAAIGVNNLAPGTTVLCGLATTTGDVVTGNYGVTTNVGIAPLNGLCTTTGTITLNNPSDHITAWASVVTGPGGATISEWSMNELPVGTVVITH